MRRQRGSGVWLPTDREIARLGRARKDAEGYWVWPDGTRLPPIAGGSGPAFDQALGTGANNGTGGTCSINPVAAAVPQAELVVALGGGNQSANLTGQSFSDSAANVYTAIKSVAGSATVPPVLIAASFIGTALTTSSTITYAETFNTSGTQTRCAAGSFTGCGPLATAIGNTATGTAGDPTVTLNSIPAGSAVVFVTSAVGTGSGGSISGWTSLDFQSSSSPCFGAFYRIYAAGGTLSPTWVNGANGDWSAAIAAFPALSSGAPPYIIGARNTYH